MSHIAEADAKFTVQGLLNFIANEAKGSRYPVAGSRRGVHDQSIIADSITKRSRLMRTYELQYADAYDELLKLSKYILISIKRQIKIEFNHSYALQYDGFKAGMRGNVMYCTLALPFRDGSVEQFDLRIIAERVVIEFELSRSWTKILNK